MDYLEHLQVLLRDQLEAEGSCEDGEILKLLDELVERVLRLEREAT